MTVPPSHARGRRPGAAARPSRERSLDGLRGLAALVVVLHHSLLCIPALADPYFPSTRNAPVGSLARALTWTPLHLVWAGGEAVLLFFVLSGYVLMRWEQRGMNLRAYYPQRLARLYLPVIPAVVLGTALVVLVPRLHDAALGPWIAGHPGASAKGVVKDLVLVLGPSKAISPLWSLSYEVLYSVAAPLVGFAILWLAARSRRWAPVCALLALGYVAAMSARGMDKPFGLFGLFVLGATLVPIVDGLVGGRRTAPHWLGVPVLVVALLLFTAAWWPRVGNSVAPALGSMLLVLLAATWPPAQHLLESRVVRWLGTISFSLYLVHEPIVVSIGILLGPGHGAWVLPIALPVALTVGWLFWRFVEAPAHRLSRMIGRRAAGGSAGRGSHRPDEAAGIGLDDVRQPVLEGQAAGAADGRPL